MSKPTSPLAGMGLGQKIAAAALLVLATIAAIAFLAGGGSSGSTGGASSGFTPQSYASGASSSHTGRSHGSDSSDDALATVALAQLPAEARHTVALVDAGGPFPYSRDGIVFGNFQHALPKHPSGWYHEYTVKTPGASNRGTRRIIRGDDGTMYYTGDHYRTFERIER